MLLLLAVLMVSATAQAPVDETATVDASEAPLLQAPELVGFVDAPYPEEAAAAGIEGTVLLQLEIGEDGAVRAVEVLREAGHGFDEAAVEAARAFTFTPAVDETGPVPVLLEFEYGFTLEEAPPDPEAELPVSLEGTAVEKGTRRPLEGITVWVVLDGGPVECRTDAAGVYAFRLPPGAYEVHARHPGYEEQLVPVEVLPDQVSSLRLWMLSRSYRANESVGTYERQREPDLTRRTITMGEVRRVPGTFGDPVRVIQSLPGAARSPGLSSQLILRGANPGDSNVYIDGVEVPIIFHLGGFRSVLNPSLISTVDYLPGGYGVRYGRSIGGVVDVRTTDEVPEQWEATWHTDMLDSSLYAAGRAGRVGVAASARRSYLDWLLVPLLPDDAPTVKPRWWDYQLKVTALDRGDDTLSLMLFGFQDLMLIHNPDGFSEGTDEEGTDGLSARYQTHRLVGTWEHRLGPRLEVFFQPLLGWDDVRLDLLSEVGIAVRSAQVGLRGEVRWDATDSLRVVGGVDSTLGNYAVEFSIKNMPAPGSDPLKEGEPLSLRGKGYSTSPDPFVDLQWRPLAEPDDLVVAAGARLTTTLDFGTRVNEEPTDEVVTRQGVDPRVAVLWRPVEGGTLKAGSGLYQQPPENADLGADKLERAWSSEVGWKQRFGSWGSADLTAFYKRIDRRAVLPDDADPDADTLWESTGRGRVVGAEVLVRKEPVGPLFGWVSYTLSRSELEDAEGEWIRFDYDQTHILTVVAGYRFPWDFDLSARFQHVTGNPYTPYEGAVYHMDSGSWRAIQSDATNSARLPPFTALDLKISRLWTYKRWQLETYIDLLNVIHGENPEVIIYNYDYTESTYIQGLPIIPSFGIEAIFHF